MRSSAAGFVSQDVITIGDIRVETQDFAELTNFSGEAWTYQRFDGILGLGHDTSAVNRIVPPLYNMINQGLLDEPVLAFYFSNSSAEEDESQVTFGGIDRNYFTGEIVKLPIRREGEWEVELNAITFGEEVIQLNNTGAAFDTGTSLLGLPTTIAEHMYDLSLILVPHKG